MPRIEEVASGAVGEEVVDLPFGGWPVGQCYDVVLLMPAIYRCTNIQSKHIVIDLTQDILRFIV